MKLRDRFMEKVAIDADTGCWHWTACKRKNGYGAFGMERRVEYAHRASYLIHKGEIPKGIYVCHRCDNPGCVNPDHLFLGTAKDNMQDASRKGRVVIPKDEQRLRGERQPMAKLTNEQVREIRKSKASNKALAECFGVDASCISHIRRGKTWRTVV